jgi:hypothetical protein
MNKNMKTYLSVLLQNNIDINTIFQTKLAFFTALKNVKPEFNSTNNLFYIFKLSNDLIRNFAKHHALFYFPSFQLLRYRNDNDFGNKDEINDLFKRNFSLNFVY